MIKRPESGWQVQGITTHPGVVLREDFMAPLELTTSQLALRTKMPSTRIAAILHEKRSVSPDSALRLARCFGTSPEFWLNLQAAHDLSKARLALKTTIDREVEPLQLTAIGA